MHWKWCESLCRQKEGDGIGFCRIQFNQALLANQMWIAGYLSEFPSGTSPRRKILPERHHSQGSNN